LIDREIVPAEYPGEIRPFLNPRYAAGDSQNILHRREMLLVLVRKRGMAISNPGNPGAPFSTFSSMVWGA